MPLARLKTSVLSLWTWETIEPTDKEVEMLMPDTWDKRLFPGDMEAGGDVTVLLPRDVTCESEDEWLLVETEAPEWSMEDAAVRVEYKLL